jgi:hypothetical protein
VNVRAFLAFLQDRSEVWTATITLGSTNNGRGVDLAIFAGIWTYFICRGAFECVTIGLSRGAGGGCGRRGRSHQALRRGEKAARYADEIIGLYAEVLRDQGGTPWSAWLRASGYGKPLLASRGRLQGKSPSPPVLRRSAWLQPPSRPTRGMRCVPRPRRCMMIPSERP